MQHHFNQTMDWTNRQLVPQSFVLPGPGVMEAIPAREIPEMSADINVEMRLLWFYQIKEIVTNWPSFAEMIRQCISWMREGL